MGSRLMILVMYVFRGIYCQSGFNVYKQINTDVCIIFDINGTFQQDRGFDVSLYHPRNEPAICSYSESACRNGYADIRYLNEYRSRLNCSFSQAKDKLTFCLSKITASDAGLYRLFISYQHVGVNGTLFVMDKPELPYIGPRYAEVGSTVVIFCTTLSTSLPTGQPFSYEWTVNGSVPTNPRYNISNNRLQIEGIEMKDKYNLIQCVATEENGISSKRQQRLQVYNRPIANVSATGTGIVGKELILTCNASHEPAELGFSAVFWEYNREQALIKLPSCERVTWCYFTSTTGVFYACKGNSFTMTLSPAIVTHNLNNTLVRCIIVYGDGITDLRADFTLHVFDLHLASVTSFTILPSSNVQEETLVNMTCAFQSDMETTVTWVRKNSQGEMGLLQHIRRTTSTFTIVSASCLDSGNYTCSVLNRDGSMVSRTAELIVHCQPKIEGCTQDKTNVNIRREETIKFTVSVIAYPEPAVDIWMESESKKNVSMTKYFEIKLRRLGFNITATVARNISKAAQSEGYWISFRNDYGNDTCFYRIHRISDSMSRENYVVIGVLSGVIFSVVVLVGTVILLKRKQPRRGNGSADAYITTKENATVEVASRDNPAFSSYEDLDVSGSTEKIEEHNHDDVDHGVYENAHEFSK